MPSTCSFQSISTYQLEEGDPASWSFLADLHGNKTITSLIDPIVQFIRGSPNLVPVNMDMCYRGTHPAATPISRCGNGQIALTFDDGPVVGLTDKVLDELKKNGDKSNIFRRRQLL